MNDVKSNRKLVEEFCAAVFVNRDLSDLDRYMKDSYIQHNPDVPQGKTGFRQFFEMTFKAMPDFRYILKDIVAGGDKVWVYSTSTGTHTGGEWLGMLPMGKRLSFDVVDIFRIEDGKLAEHWDVADTLTLFTQIGKVEA